MMSYAPDQCYSSPTSSYGSEQQENQQQVGSPELLRCKRRVNFGDNSSFAMPPPVTVARRNERERNRVKMVNMGFATLRQHVPAGVKNKKMSKVDTLRAAVSYIKELQSVLNSKSELHSQR